MEIQKIAEESARPIWEVWQDHLPAHPLAADVFADGVRRMPRVEALKHENIQFNTDRQIRWLNFDIDQSDAYDALDRANLPMPNIFVQNRDSGHGHALYALATFVGLTDASRTAPIKLAADVQRGMTRRFGADSRYANCFAKNPISQRWAASFIAPNRYHLSDLLAALDRADIRRPPERVDMTGLGRNCDLFDIVRVWAYGKIIAAKRTMTSGEWLRAVFAEVEMRNLGFGVPLPISETRQIAKSIAGWTWRKFSTEEFSGIQAKRRAPSAEAQRNETRSLIDAVVGDNPDKVMSYLSHEEANDRETPARRLKPMAVFVEQAGRSARTIRRYLAEDRADYLAQSLERVAPWTDEGISRSTWYRRRRAATKQ